jgi:hypothetical protein
MAARTNKKGNATGNCSCSMEKDADRDEEDPKLPLVDFSVRRGSDPDQEEVVQEERTPNDVPSGRTRTQLEPSPANRKRPRTCLAENGQVMTARMNQRGNVTGNCSSMVEEDADYDEEDPKLPLVAFSVRRGSDPDQEEVVQEEATTDDVPSGWTRTKLEPSSANRKRPRTCHAESGRVMAARTSQRGNATGSCSTVEKDADRDEEDPKVPLGD